MRIVNGLLWAPGQLFCCSYFTLTKKFTFRLGMYSRWASVCHYVCPCTVQKKGKQTKKQHEFICGAFILAFFFSSVVVSLQKKYIVNEKWRKTKNNNWRNRRVYKNVRRNKKKKRHIIDTTCWLSFGGRWRGCSRLRIPSEWRNPFEHHVKCATQIEVETLLRKCKWYSSTLNVITIALSSETGSKKCLSQTNIFPNQVKLPWVDVLPLNVRNVPPLSARMLCHSPTYRTRVDTFDVFIKFDWRRLFRLFFSLLPLYLP